MLTADPVDPGGVSALAVDADVAITFDVTDLVGTPITTIEEGNDFLLRMFVQDVRADVDAADLGVFALYADITYDASLVSVVAADPGTQQHGFSFEVDFVAPYTNGLVGDASTAGLLDNLGAFQSGFDPVGGSVLRMVDVRFTAADAGIVDFASITAQDVSVLAPDAVDIPIDSIDFGTTSLRILGPPTANPDSETTLEGAATVVDILDNDADETGLDPASVIITQDAANGETSVNPTTGEVTYTPGPDYFGPDTFKYTVADDDAMVSNEATVTITVDPVNDVPSFTIASAHIAANTAGAQSIANFASNISPGPANESGQTVSFQVTNISGASGLFDVLPTISSTGTLNYTPASDTTGTATVTVQLVDSGGTDDGGVNTSPTQSFTITTVDASTIVLHNSLVRTPTAVDSRGKPAGLPTDEIWIDEWTPFYIEVYATGDLSAAIVTADLIYNTTFFTATSIEFGPLFDNANSSGTINDAAGLVDNIGGKASEAGAGVAEQILVARVALRPLSGDTGVAHNADGHPIEPVDTDWLSIADTRIEGAPTPISTDPLPTTSLLPVMYDVDDSGDVGFGDFSFLSASFQRSVTDPGAPSAYAVDWDFSEFVDFGDFSFFSANFGRTKFDGTPLLYPVSFPSQILAQNLNQGISQFSAQSTDPAEGGSSDGQTSLRRYSYAMSAPQESNPLQEGPGEELAAVDQLFQNAGQGNSDDPVTSVDSSPDNEAGGSALSSDTDATSSENAENNAAVDGPLDSPLTPVDLAEDEG